MEYLIKQYLKNILELATIFIDRIVLLWPITEKTNFDICVVKVDALGDYILSLDSLFNISLKYINKRKILICNELIYI